MTEPETISAADSPDRPASMRGPWLVTATLSLFVIVPAVVWPLFRLIEADLSDPDDYPPLIWAERTDWPAFDVRFKSLERGPMSKGRTGERFNPKYNLEISPEFEASIARCREQVTGSAAGFTSPEVRAALELETDAHPDHFYAHALLALWHQAAGNPDAADAAWSSSFAAAPAAVTQQIKDAEGGPQPGINAGTISFAFDRVVADHLDPSLVLIYPDVATDAEGVWRLPVFKSILRITDPALGPAAPNDPYGQPSITFVGQVGRLPAAAD